MTNHASQLTAASHQHTSRKPGRSFLALKIGILAGSLVVPLLLAELVVRKVYHEQLDTEYLRQHNRELFIGDFVTPSPDPDLLYELKPGVRTEWMGVTVVTHETEPVRVSTLDQSITNPAIRLAIVGDSMSFGWRINAENTYGEILRVHLEESLGVPVEVRNYSVPGYNSLQERILLEKTIVKDKPDIVILNYTHNDPDPTNTVPEGYMPPEYGDNFLRSALLKLTLRGLRFGESANSRLISQEGESEEFYDSFRSGGPIYDAHLEELRRFARVARNNDILPIAFNYCPYGLSPHSHYEVLHAPFEENLKESGFVYYDAYPDHRTHMTTQGWTDHSPFIISKTDSHPNVAGHEYAGNLLHAFLTTNDEVNTRLQKLASSYVSTGGHSIADTRIAKSYREAVAMSTRGEFAKAIPLFQGILEVNPDNGSVWIKLAEAYEGAGQTDDATKAYKEVIRRDSKSVHARRRLADIYFAQDEDEKAIRELKDLLACDANPRFQINVGGFLGSLLLKEERIDEARAVYERLQELTGDPHSTPDVFLGEAYLEHRDAASALPLLEKAVRDTPDNLRAREALVNGYSMQNLPDKVLAQLSVLLENQPNNIPWLKTASWLMACNSIPTPKTKDQALSYGRRAVELTSKNDPDCLLTLAAALANADRFDEAVEAASAARGIFARGGNTAAVAHVDGLLSKFKEGRPHRL